MPQNKPKTQHDVDVQTMISVINEYLEEHSGITAHNDVDDPSHRTALISKNTALLDDPVHKKEIIIRFIEEKHRKELSGWQYVEHIKAVYNTDIKKLHNITGSSPMLYYAVQAYEAAKKTFKKCTSSGCSISGGNRKSKQSKQSKRSKRSKQSKKRNRKNNSHKSKATRRRRI